MPGFASDFVKWLTGSKKKDSNGLTAVEAAVLSEVLVGMNAAGKGLTLTELRDPAANRYPDAGTWQAIDGLYYPYRYCEDNSDYVNPLSGLLGWEREIECFGPRGFRNRPGKVRFGCLSGTLPLLPRRRK